MAEPAFPDTTAASLSSLSTSQQKYSNSSGNNECAASTPSDWSRARQVQRQASKTLMVFLIHDLPLPSVQKDYLTLLQYCLQTWICGFSDHERLRECHCAPTSLSKIANTHGARLWEATNRLAYSSWSKLGQVTAYLLPLVEDPSLLLGPLTLSYYLPA